MLNDQTMGNRPLERFPKDEALTYEEDVTPSRTHSAYDTRCPSSPSPDISKTIRSNSLLTRLRLSFRRESKERPQIRARRRVGNTARNNNGRSRPTDFLRKAYNSFIDRRESGLSSGSNSSSGRSEEVGVPVYLSSSHAQVREHSMSPEKESVPFEPSASPPLFFAHGSNSPSLIEGSPEQSDLLSALNEAQIDLSVCGPRLHPNSVRTRSSASESVQLAVPGILRSHSEHIDLRNRGTLAEVRFADQKTPSKESSSNYSVTFISNPPLATNLKSGEAKFRSSLQKLHNAGSNGNATVAQQISRLKHNSKHKGSRASTQSQYFLTIAQISLVRQVWNQIFTTKGPTVIGSLLFDRLFFKYPKSKEIFSKIDLSNGRFSNQDQLLKSHAKSVAIMIDSVIQSLEDMELESRMLEAIGARHAAFYHLGFRVQLWDQFAQALLDRTLEWGEKSKRVEDSRKAWAVIISFMVDKLQRGFKEARKGRPRATTVPQTGSTAKKVHSEPILHEKY